MKRITRNNSPVYERFEFFPQSVSLSKGEWAPAWDNKTEKWTWSSYIYYDWLSHSDQYVLYRSEFIINGGERLVRL